MIPHVLALVSSATLPMVRRLRFRSIRRLTNKPANVQTFRNSDIDLFEQLPLRVGRNLNDQAYLSVKALKSGNSL